MELALLDTDMLTEVLKRKTPRVVKRAAVYLREHGQFAISSFTRYEALRGLRERGAEKQILRFAEFCEHSLILPITDAVLDRAVSLWLAGRRQGVTPCDADLIIAATAYEHDRVLVTGNTIHFEWMSGLKLDNWRS